MKTIENLILKSGAHGRPEDGMCIMEAAAYIAGAPFSDHPPCVSPVLGAFLRPWNDSFPDDETRTRYLGDLPARILNTAGDKTADRRRVEIFVDLAHELAILAGLGAGEAGLREAVWDRTREAVLEAIEAKPAAAE